MTGTRNWKSVVSRIQQYWDSGSIYVLEVFLPWHGYWFMSNQETSFVTIGQRLLASPLKVRFHYGHPDVFDRLFHLTRGGISKASTIINLSDDIFAGFNSTLRGGNITHHEYIQVGKGMDVGLNQISQFEAKIANGNGEQTMSRDIYRLGHRFDFFRMLSCYFTTIGVYFSNLLAPIFFTFSLGTKTHYFGRTLLHGGAEYRGTGRGFVVFHAKFTENYRLYSRSHFVKGIELMVLLLVYHIFGRAYEGVLAYLLITVSIWFMVGSWLFAPFLFNPSGFEWQKIVEDWSDWKKWMLNRGGIGVSHEKSWESWWEKEQNHLKYSGARGIIVEILLALRFFIYQYGLVYHLTFAKHSKSFLVYGLSWIVILVILFVVKAVSVGRRKFSANFQLVFRMINGVIFIISVAVLIALVVIVDMQFRDLVVCILALMPSGWGLLLIAQALKPLVVKMGIWASVQTLARGYELFMGLLLFTPVAFLAWFPFVSEFQTRMLFNQAFSRGLQISRILGGPEDKSSGNKE